MWGWQPYGAMSGLGWLWMLLELAVLVLLVYWLVRGFSSQGQGTNRDRAQDILRERYAKGEIDQEVYERMRRDLSA
ncbi:MAG: SHOCT domain-containing protein [Deinococcota bacterium]